MRKTVPFILFTLLVTALFAQQEKPIQSYTLREAVDYALQNNYNIKNAKLDEAKAKAHNWEILTTGMPQINANLDYSYYFKVPKVPALTQSFTGGGDAKNSSFGQVVDALNKGVPNISTPLNQLLNSFGDISFVLPNTVTAGVGLQQLVFDARYFIGVKATKDLLITSRLTTQTTDLEIENTVTKAYYQAEAAQEAKSLLVDNMKVVDKLVNDTRKVFEQGLTEELDVNRLELARATLESQINNQNRLADVATANLKYQMGLPLDAPIILRDKLSDLKASAGIALENKFDASLRPEFQLLTTAVKLHKYDVARNRSGYYPYLNAFLNYSENSQTVKFGDMFRSQTSTDASGNIIHSSNWYQQGTVGFSLKVPIFDSGLKNSQLKQAKFELQKTQNQLEDFKNAATLQFQVAQSTLNNAVADEATNQRALDFSKKIFDTNQVKFKNGVGSSFELEQAEQDYATNQLKYIQSLTTLLTSKADLDKAMGK